MLVSEAWHHTLFAAQSKKTWLALEMVRPRRLASAMGTPRGGRGRLGAALLLLIAFGLALVFREDVVLILLGPRWLFRAGRSGVSSELEEDDGSLLPTLADADFLLTARDSVSTGTAFGGGCSWVGSFFDASVVISSGSDRVDADDIDSSSDESMLSSSESSCPFFLLRFQLEDVDWLLVEEDSLEEVSSAVEGTCSNEIKVTIPDGVNG